MTQLIPVPIPYNTHSAPMTEQDVKGLLGIYIVLLFIYFITSAIAVIRYYKDREEEKGYFGLNFWEDYYFTSDSLFIWLINILMTSLNAILLLVWLGSMVAKFF